MWVSKGEEDGQWKIVIWIIHYNNAKGVLIYGLDHIEVTESSI